MPQDAPYARAQYNERRRHSETPGAGAFAVGRSSSQAAKDPKPAGLQVTPPRREPEVEKSNVLPACRTKNRCISQPVARKPLCAPPPRTGVHRQHVCKVDRRESRRVHARTPDPASRTPAHPRSRRRAHSHASPPAYPSPRSTSSLKQLRQKARSMGLTARDHRFSFRAG